MNTLKRGFFLRIMSVMLTVLMLCSVFSLSITATSAAEVDLAETGASRTFAAGDYIYVKNFTPSGWSANWFHSDVTEWMHIWNSSTNTSIDVKFELVEGTENATGAIYGAKITTAGTYTHVIFTRSHSTTDPWYNCNQTGDIPLDATNNCYTNFAVGGTSYTGSVYTPTGGGGEVVVPGNGFWVDLDGDNETTIDRISASEDFKESDKYSHNVYFICLPSSVKTQYDAGNTTVKVFCNEGDNVTIDGITISSAGTDIDLATISDHPALGGNYSGYVYFKFSENISSIHTTTSVSVPQGTYQGYESKDDYETKGSIVVLGPDGTQKNSDTVLKKIKGRGNSSWEASHKIIGKYAFNITLDKKAKLLDESEASKKYCLVSYNADEARMRNMIVYELAQMIGVKYTPDYEPVDLYNNGEYIGTYLLTDKVEIGDPLVDIVDLDGINEDFSDNNTALYDDDSLMTRGSSSGSLSDNSTKNYYKYISNLDEPDPSTYAESGFLLEFELNERFADEISGFISSKGQQIVCKYPEYATKNEIKFIRDKWNTAEALMYDDTATYEELDAVIDVESFAKMYLIQELTKNLDGGATSFYVFYDGGKLHAGVAWDYDWTLGQYEKTYTDRVNSGSDFYDRVDADPSESGGWYMNSKNIYGASNFNAQAALCQNDNFWSVVVAEWDEIFYKEAIKFADSTVSSVSALDGIIGGFYETVKATTILDEFKWGLIKSDPFITNNWGSTETGDTHDDAVVWLNNWYYNRLTWMDKYISVDGSSHTGIYDVDYVIQPPTITPDKELYAVGETVTLTIDDKTDGDYTYTIYKDGVELDTTTEKTYTLTAAKAAVGEYSVVAVSNTSNKVSEESEASEVVVEGLSFSVDVSAPTGVTAGDVIDLQADSNITDGEVTYKLYLNTELEETLLETNTTGTFEYLTTSNDADTTLSFTIVGETTIDGELYTDSIDVDVRVSAFEFNVVLTAPATVEAGMTINLKVETNSSETVVYEFYDGEGNILAANGTGMYSVEALDSEIGTQKSFYVVAKTTVGGKTFIETSDTKKVTISAVSEMFDVTIYFKSTSTLGYRPLITTEGAVAELTDAAMQRDILIGITNKNATQTATYYWYSADVQVSKANPQLSVSILSSRYAMEGDITLNIVESGEIYLAVDNLNTSYEMHNLTDWTVTERNWTESAVNMILDKDDADAESLEELSANITLRHVGDSNADGKVNIKDATMIQKNIAGLVSLDRLSFMSADVNGDGKVTISDATAIMKKLVALA